MKLFKRRPTTTPERRHTPRQAASESDSSSGAFRRGRTLTGSVSPLVRAPSEASADLKSSRVHSHELLRRRRRLTSVFLATCIVAGGLYVLVSQFTAQPVVRASPDPTLQLGSVYEDVIDEYMTDHLADRWRFMTNSDRLTRYMQARTPEVKNVTPRGSNGFGKSVFEIVFREPIASWDVEGRQLYVDTNGIPFDKNYYGATSLHIVDRSGMTSSTPGQSIMSNRFMGYIGQVIGLSSKQGYAVSSIVIPQGMTRQIEVYIKGVEYPVKFSSDRPAGEGVEDMVRAITWMQARQLTPEYIDVRVSGRVFYR